MAKQTFTLGDLADKMTDGDLVLLAKMLNDVGADPRLDETAPMAWAEVARETVIDLVVDLASGRRWPVE
mgnify:FL=1